jgi:hypothetical protein
MELEEIAKYAFMIFAIVAIVAGLAVGYMAYDAGTWGGDVADIHGYIMLVMLILGIIVGLVSITAKEVTPFLICRGPRNSVLLGNYNIMVLRSIRGSGGGHNFNEVNLGPSKREIAFFLSLFFIHLCNLSEFVPPFRSNKLAKAKLTNRQCDSDFRWQ